MTARRTALEPDGIHGRALGLALEILGPTVREIFSACQGHVSMEMETGRAGTTAQARESAGNGGRLPSDLPAERNGQAPLERVISGRVANHLITTDPDLYENQSGGDGQPSTP